MAAARALRAVAPDEKPPRRRRPLTLAQAIESGDHLQILLAQRRDIVRALPEAKGAPLAALHGQLSKISREIELLKAPGVVPASGGPAAAVDDSFDPSAI